MMRFRIMGGQTLNFMGDFLYFMKKSQAQNATLYAGQLSPMLYNVVNISVQLYRECKVAGVTQYWQPVQV